MKERDGNRKYFYELFGAMTLYGVVLFGSISVGRPMEPGLSRTLLLLAPMIPLALAIWAIARHFRRVDEFVRLRSLESLSIAAAVTAALSLTYGFLESAGFPKLSMGLVWPVMGAVWGVHACLRVVFSR
jgi:hypothetical protein